MRDPKTVPKIPLYLRLSKSLTYLCFSVILFSSGTVTWAQDLEGSIPNENGDYCVLVPDIPTLLGGGNVTLIAWSSTDNVSVADINGDPIFLAGCTHDCPGANTEIYYDIEKTTSYVLTVLPNNGSEYSCSTSVTVLETPLSEPKEDNCFSTVVPVRRSSSRDGEEQLYVYIGFRWNKIENDTYRVKSYVRSSTNGFNLTKGWADSGTGGTFSDYLKITNLPVTYTAKVYWDKKDENNTYKSYDVVSHCSVTVEGMLPDKLPVTSQPVQPTQLTYNDGLQAGKQLCIDDPGACGIDSNSSAGLCGIDISDGVAIFNTLTNILTIPAIDVSLIDEEGFEYTERFEAQMQAESPTNLTQFNVTGLEAVSPQLPDILPDHPALSIGEDFVKEYLTLEQQTKAVKVLNALQKADQLVELLNGLNRHRDNPVKQALYGLEFILRHSKYVSFGVLVEEDTLVRTYEAINGILSDNVRTAGLTETFGIRVMKEKWGWIPDKAISDVNVTIHQITKYQSEEKNYCVFYELQELSDTDKPLFRCPTGKPETFQGETREYGQWAYGYSFKRSNGVGIPLGLYLVEVSDEYDKVLKVETVLINSDNQTLTIYLE